MSHFSQDCRNDNVEVTSSNQVSNCYGCCNTNTYPTNCIYGTGSSCGVRNSYYSCENITPKWKTYYPFYINGERRIDCQRLSYIDYNRYKYARANDVESPQDVWAIDFWFKTSTNLATTERGRTQLFTTEGNNNNFNEFIIEWNYHNKIRVYKEVVSELENKFAYIVECTPLIVESNPELNSKEIYRKNINDVHYKWSFIACGVNFQEKNFYLTDTNQFY